jgi:hypothetical protein
VESAACAYVSAGTLSVNDVGSTWGRGGDRDAGGIDALITASHAHPATADVQMEVLWCMGMRRGLLVGDEIEEAIAARRLPGPSRQLPKQLCRQGESQKSEGMTWEACWEGSEGENGERWDAGWKGWRDRDGDGEGVSKGSRWR